MDNISTSERSYIMSLVRSKHTKPELLIRKFIHSKGYRFRLHNSHLPGKPDIVLTRFKIVIFVHGCFWHGHQKLDCKLARIPKSNVAFWVNKINSNLSRDAKNRRELKRLGWFVIEIWECQLKKKLTFDTLIKKIERKNFTIQKK